LRSWCKAKQASKLKADGRKIKSHNKKKALNRGLFSRGKGGGNRSGQETQGAESHHGDSQAKVKKLSSVKDQRSQSMLPL